MHLKTVAAVTGVTDVDVDARVCCATGSEVWAARRQGNMTVFDAFTSEVVGEVLVSVGGNANTIIVAMAAVFDEIWTATLDGEMLVYSSKSREYKGTVQLSGKGGGKAKVTHMSFDGHVAAVATDAGCIYVVHPLRKCCLHTLCCSAPCASAAHYYSFLICGDTDGALSIWDTLTGDCVLVNARSKSSVTHILHEKSTGTVWVARENRSLDVYRLKDEDLLLVNRLEAIGRVTGLAEVSGVVVATTFEKRLIAIDASACRVVAAVDRAHQGFIHGIAKVHHQETARLWTYANDGATRLWDVQGADVAVCGPPFLHPRAQAALATSATSTLLAEKAALGAGVERQRGLAVGMAEDLRTVREEAQELRLRLMKVEKNADAKDAELARRVEQLRELEETHSKTVKDMTELASKVSVAERERAMVQADLGTTKDELTRARTETLNMVSEKAKLDQEASQLRTDKAHLETRIRDADNRAASLQAEHARLCASVGDVSAAKCAEKNAQAKILQSSAAAGEELQHVKKLNTLLSSALASMLYTIRRKEAEERDLTALINAYRRRVADHVTDPFLSALLVATMVRNPERFEMDCDEATKTQLLDRNGPFIQFIHTLHEADAEAYETLIGYLQDQSAADALSAEARGSLERLLNLATQEGAVGPDAIASFKRSLPGLVNSDSALRPSLASAVAGSAALGAGAASGTGGGAAGSDTALWGGDLTAYIRTLSSDAAATESVSASLLREIRSQRAIDENYVREQQAMFEFILKTRRTLVECLVLLQKRTASARQVVVALSVNLSSSNAATAAGSPVLSSPSKSLRPMHTVFSEIISELVELTTSIVSQYLTDSEKQRLNVQ